MIRFQFDLKDLSQSKECRAAQNYILSIPPGRHRTDTISEFIKACPLKLHISPDADDDERLDTLLSTMRFMDWYIDAIDERKAKKGVCLCDVPGQRECGVYTKDEMKTLMIDLRDIIRNGDAIAPEIYVETAVDMCGNERHMFVLTDVVEIYPISMLGVAHDKLIMGRVFAFKTKANRDAVYEYITN